MSEKYLIFLDIIGFQDLPREIAQATHVEEKKVRSDLIDTIEERLCAIEEKGEILGKTYLTDDWILVTDSLDLAIKVVSEVLDHKTGYKDYQSIPLEIGIGSGNYDRWAKFVGKDLICEEDTVKLLKTDIIKYYHRWYEKTHGSELKSTFVIITQSIYQEMEPLDRKMCQNVPYLIDRGTKKEKETIGFFVADVSGITRRGKVFEFLEKIGRKGSKLYDRIDYLYVPPVEYDAIKETLQKNKVVFITGTPEYGKTYTAVRLLWEYFNMTYEPIWRAGGERSERTETRKRMEDIGKELVPHRVIYFEDPFGSMEYEARESLERDIGGIVELVRKNQLDAYVIITSREEVFKRFKNEKVPLTDLGEFEKKLGIKRQSYDYKRRKDMLIRWAEAKACKWSDDTNLMELVLKSLENRAVLPTPLGIRDFVFSTVDVKDSRKLLEDLRVKSEETAKGFAKEIEKMPSYMMAFLIYPLVSFFKVDVLRVLYRRLVEEVEMEEEPWTFENVLGWFKDDKIDVSGEVVMFSHPSYGEAVRQLLSREDQLPQTRRDIIHKIPFMVLEQADFQPRVAEFVERDFSYLSKDLRNGLLLKLGEICRTKNVTSMLIADHVSRAIAGNFGSLPDEVGNILFELSKYDISKCSVARSIISNYSNLPESVQVLVFDLSGDSVSASTVADAIVQNFNNLPENVQDRLFELCNSKIILWTSARSIVKNFGTLPSSVTDLLSELADDDGDIAETYADDVARAIVEEFGRVPENVRSLLFRLCDKAKTNIGVGMSIVFDFANLPDSVKELLFKLSDEPRNAESIAWAIVLCFGNLPDRVRNLVFKLWLKIDNTEDIEDLAQAIIMMYSILPTDFRNLLFKLADFSQTALSKIEKLVTDDRSLPNDFKSELLSSFSEKRRTYRESGH
ncbi:MAG: hypothetical protein WED05_05725 [Candidatus Atabeyarchaeum deiterrae]